MFSCKRYSAQLLLLCPLLFILLACSSTTPVTSASKPPTPTAVGTFAVLPHIDSMSCAPGSLIHPTDGGIEVQGRGSNAQLWALVQFSTDVAPLPPNNDVKIVWRMTGSGPFTLTAYGPSATKIGPKEGPDVHSGSSWQRPGDEWGSMFNFPKPGCWNIQATRSGSTGNVWLLIK